MVAGSYEVCLGRDTVVHDVLIQFHWVLFLLSQLFNNGVVAILLDWLDRD